MDDAVAKKYMIMRSLAKDMGLDTPKITLGKEICKCEILDRSGNILFEGNGDIPDVAISSCYKDLLIYIEKKGDDKSDKSRSRGNMPRL